MPCDLGFRSSSQVRVAAPAPQTFEARVAPPALDAELLERLGQEDPPFADWLLTLEPEPLLAEALRRTLAVLPAPSALTLAIRGGRLAARGTSRSAKERAGLDRSLGAIARRWQLEVLRVIAELLDFEAVLEEDLTGLVVEGEKPGPGDVREFVRITLPARGEAELRFEHYRSEGELAADEDRLLALAQKLGVPLVVKAHRRAGQPIPEGARHRHPGKKRGKS